MRRMYRRIMIMFTGLNRREKDRDIRKHNAECGVRVLRVIRSLVKAWGDRLDRRLFFDDYVRIVKKTYIKSEWPKYLNKK